MKKYVAPLLNKKINIQISVPGSKSITNRAFLLSALCNNKVFIHGALESDDTKYMKKALQDLGVKISNKNNIFEIHGTGGNFIKGVKTLFLGNAGTAVRFLTATMLLRKDKTIIDGVERMRNRPIKDLIDSLRELGAKIESKTGCPPISIEGAENYKESVTMKGNNSSQYFSALMQIAPLLKNGLNIAIDGELVSKPYIDITIHIMKQFGAEVVSTPRVISIKPQKYQAKEFFVEGDASSASYWFALAAVTRSTVTVKNLSYTSCQGDVHFVDVLEKMGCKVAKGLTLNAKEKQQFFHLKKENTSKVKPYGITVTGPKKLKALGKINMNAMPDVAMTLAVVATFAEGETIIVDVANMRIKETDRIKALVTEMKKMGIKCEELPDGLIIHGSSDINLRHGAEIETYDDHRMAMCFSVLGAVIPNTVILNPNCVSKTYPNFFKEWDKAIKK